MAIKKEGESADNDSDFEAQELKTKNDLKPLTGGPSDESTASSSCTKTTRCYECMYIIYDMGRMGLGIMAVSQN